MVEIREFTEFAASFIGLKNSLKFPSFDKHVGLMTSMRL